MGNEYSELAENPMHPTDKKVWPIVIILSIPFFIFVLLPEWKLQQEREDTEAQVRIQKDEEQQRNDEETQRLRDAIRSFGR
jgi:hypothetical protein